MLEETYLLTLRQLHLETTLNGMPPTMSALAARRELSASAIAKHYAVLVEAGLITHVRRSPRSAVLTSAGRALARASQRGVRRTIASAPVSSS